MFDDYYDGYSAGYYHGSGAAAGVGIIGGIILIGGLLFILPVVAAIILFIVVEFLIIRACVENGGDHWFLTVLGCIAVFFIFAAPTAYYIALKDYMNHDIYSFGKPVIIYVDSKEYPKTKLTENYIIKCGKKSTGFGKSNCFYHGESGRFTVAYMIIPKYKEAYYLSLNQYNKQKRRHVDISETMIDKSKDKPFYPLRFYMQDDKLVQMERGYSLFQYKYGDLTMEDLYKDVPFSRYYNKN